MINFSFNLDWPWFKSIKGGQKDYIEKNWKLSKYKILGVQLSKAGKTLIGFSFSWDHRCDHAGVILDLMLFRYFFVINLYDIRHWNYEKNRYVNYDDIEEVKEYL